MKLSLPLKQYPGGNRQIFVILVSVLMFTSLSSGAANTVFTKKHLPVHTMLSQCNAGDTIMVQKQHTSRKHGIKLYPDAAHQVLFFEVKGVYGKAYQLFIFDVEGKLVKQVNIKNKQTTVLENIEKGDYSFEVFSDDERIENGQVIVR